MVGYRVSITLKSQDGPLASRFLVSQDATPRGSLTQGFTNLASSPGPRNRDMLLGLKKLELELKLELEIWGREDLEPSGPFRRELS